MFVASNAAIKAARIFPDLLQFSRRMPPAPPPYPTCTDANRISHRDFLPARKLIRARITSFEQIGSAVSAVFSDPTTICADRYTISFQFPERQIFVFYTFLSLSTPLLSGFVSFRHFLISFLPSFFPYHYTFISPLSISRFAILKRHELST